MLEGRHDNEGENWGHHGNRFEYQVQYFHFITMKYRTLILEQPMRKCLLWKSMQYETTQSLLNKNNWEVVNRKYYCTLLCLSTKTFAYINILYIKDTFNKVVSFFSVVQYCWSLTILSSLSPPLCINQAYNVVLALKELFESVLKTKQKQMEDFQGSKQPSHENIYSQPVSVQP